MQLQQDRNITRQFQKKLLYWYHRNQRPLPWRLCPTPYRVLISEIMLQQTQVKTVIPYYNRFVKRFPDIGSLARASDREVLKLWSGLGYYSRAHNLHRTARQIVEIHKGVIPTDLKEILALPGVGRYTAGAICSLAFNQAQPVVDGNVRRVIARLNGIRKYAPESYFWNQMTVWIPPNRSSAFNQAMMELGALICLPSGPRCPRCPVRNCCEALKTGLQDVIPRPRVKQGTERVEFMILILERNDKILLTRQTQSIIPGEWGLPVRLLHAQDSPHDAAASLTREIFGDGILPQFRTQLRHSISRYRILGHVFCGAPRRFTPQPENSLNTRWVRQSQVNALITSSLFSKALQRYKN
jgi:A/G-specific adenine glycosylase